MTVATRQSQVFDREELITLLAKQSSSPSETETLAGSAGSSSDKPSGEQTKQTNRRLSGVVNGRYAIEAHSGEGGMGAVYRVSDRLHPERRVALKCIHSAIADAQRLILFKSEFAALTGLVHPNLAGVYDLEPLLDEAGSSDDASKSPAGDWFFTMEFVDGVDLKAAVAREPNKLLDWCVELCRALSFLHRRNIVHFDLKPQNLMVDGHGRLRVLDFGLVGALGSDQLLGTPVYMAPEMIDGRDELDSRADLYSLGIVLYELLVGELPFSGSSILEILTHHARTPLKWPKESVVEPWSRSVVEKLCAKKAEDRYATANELILALQQGSGRTYALETNATMAGYVASAGFHGREREMAALLDYSQRAFKSGGDSKTPVGCFVRGLSGVGKSRLMRELRYKLQLEGRAFVEGHCFEGNAGEFDPIAEILKHLVRLAEAHGQTKLLTRHDAILRNVLKDYRPELERVEVDQGNVPGLAARFIDELGRHLELAIYINDLQWAKEGTLHTLLKLEQFAAQVSTEGIRRSAVFASYRSDEMRTTGAAERLSKSGCFAHVDLSPLAGEAVASLVGTMLGTADPPKILLDRLMAQTAGQPLFVEELMRLLVEEGTVWPSESGWALKDELSTLPLPDTVQGVYRLRIGRLDEHCQRVLQTMAAFARPIEHALLATLTEDTLDALSEKLLVLKERTMVREHRTADRLELSLMHDKLRETVYEALGETGRKALHTHMARQLLKLSGDFVYEIAHHARHGDDLVLAEVVARRACNQADGNSEHEQIIQNGLFLADRVAERNERREILERVAWSYSFKKESERGDMLSVRLLNESESAEERARAWNSRASIAFGVGQVIQCDRCALTAAKELGFLLARSKLLLWPIAIRDFVLTRAKRLEKNRPADYDSLSNLKAEIIYMRAGALALQNKALGFLLFFSGLRRSIAAGIFHAPESSRRESASGYASISATVLLSSPLHKKEDVLAVWQIGATLAPTQMQQINSAYLHDLIESTHTGAVANPSAMIGRLGIAIRSFPSSMLTPTDPLLFVIVELGDYSMASELSAQLSAVVSNDLGDLGLSGRMAAQCALGEYDNAYSLIALRVPGEGLFSTAGRLSDWMAVACYGADPKRLLVLSAKLAAELAQKLRRTLPIQARGFLVIFGDLLEHGFSDLCARKEVPRLSRKIRKAFRSLEKLPQMLPYWRMADALVAAIKGDAVSAEEFLDEADGLCGNRKGVAYITAMFRVVVRIALNARQEDQLAALRVAQSRADALSIPVLRRTIERWLPTKGEQIDALFSELAASKTKEYA